MVHKNDSEQASSAGRPKPNAEVIRLGREREPKEASAVIQLRAGALHAIATEAEAALIEAGVPFYRRGGEVVRPIVEEVAAFKKRKTHISRLKLVTVDMMRDELSRAARFDKWNGRAKKMVPADPPHDLAKTILARDGDWHFPPLVGICTTPTLRPDGTILSKPGYDPATRLLVIEPPPMPPIPEHPSRDDALAALALLGTLLEDFPFVNPASRSVALSALITPVVRGAMQVAPLHAMTAPEAGSGKSYLIDIVSTIATGQIAAVIAAGRTEEETEKRLAAEIMTAQPIISIDNLNGDLSGDFLCQAVERRILKPRVLGRSENKYIENTFTVFGNGNNMRLVGDIVRRVILCTLDADMERPELRQFRSDPIATVSADRGSYVAAALTVVRGFLAAGCPDLLPPLASFEDWSRLVRSALVWLGQPDPIDTMEAARADDPSRGNLRAVVAALLSVIGPNKPMTAGELKDKACSSDDKDLALNKAITAIACPSGRNEIDVIRLGQWLSRNKGRVIDGHKIVGEPDRHIKQMVWLLKNVRQEANMKGQER